jgi:CMP-N-acetylneuraminic acid synthetase
MRDVIGVMIAKGESLRLAKKNTRLFHGRPMFLWNLEKLVHLLPGAVYFDSDDADMLARAADAGAYPIERPAALRGHTVPSVLLFQHIVRTLPEPPGAVVNVQANSPSCRVETIRNAIHVMRHTTCDELLTIFPDGRGNNGSVWGFSIERLMNYGDPYVHEIDVMITDTATDVHTESDFEQAATEFHPPAF